MGVFSKLPVKQLLHDALSSIFSHTSLMDVVFYRYPYVVSYA